MSKRQLVVTTTTLQDWRQTSAMSNSDNDSQRRALDLLLAMLDYNRKKRQPEITPATANWILRCCGLLEAAKKIKL